MTQAHKITGFLGLLPRTAERLLPDMAATVAQNVNLVSGEIRPLMKPMEAVTSNELQNLTAYRAYNGTTEKWRRWTIDVDVARGPYPPDVEQRYYWTGDECPRYATFTNFGTTDYALGFPKPAGTPSVSVIGGSGTTTTRLYCWTYYQPATGEETEPSTPTAVVTGYINGTWRVTGMSATVTHDRAVNYNTSGIQQRLYRSAGTTATFQLVAERTASASDWDDTLTDAQILGDELISDGWKAPPVDLQGLICLPNGAMVGFHANELCYSEPYQPHAYPDKYKYQTESKIVGIAAFGTTVVVATETRPYMADGVEPGSVTMNAVSRIWPCKSKRSVCSAGDGVLYATDAGLVFIGQSGSDVFTKNFYTIEEWRELDPSSMMVRVIDNRVYIHHQPSGGSTKQLMRIDMGEQAALTTLSGGYFAIYADPLNSYLYLVGKSVDQWDAYYGTRYDWVWKSKEIELPVPTNFGAAKIEFVQTMSETELQAAYSIRNATIALNNAVIAAGINVGAFGQAEMNGDPINGATALQPIPALPEYLTYTLFDHGVPVFSKDMTSSDMFRLPSGFKTDVISHQLSGNVKVRYIKIAETPNGLKAL